MLGIRRALCVGLAALVLSNCSGNSMQAIQKWWTEDLRDRPGGQWPDEESSRYSDARREEAFLAEKSRRDEIFEQNLEPPRDQARVLKPRPPAARAAKPIASAALTQAPRRFSDPPPTTAVPPASQPSERPIVPASLVSVAGMTEAGVRGALGAPQEEKDQGLQKIWTYRGQGCSVEVIFFLDVTRNAYAALDHKTLAGDGRTRLPGPCLQSATSFPSLEP